MRKPGLGEANLGAVAGAVVAGIGGLFAVGLAKAITEQSLVVLFKTPILNLLSWLISTPFGWILGGQVGPRLGQLFNSPKAEVVGGALGGLLTVTAMAFLGWYLDRALG